LQDIEARIMQLKQICRKYGPTLAEAIAYNQQLQGELDDLSDGGQSLEDLETSYAAKQKALTQQCAILTGLRQTVAKTLETALVRELKPLAMDKVKFEVDISPTPPTAAGSDRVTFMFSPNPGEPLQPLTQVASGGEMSRFLLALKVCLAQTGDGAPEHGATMVFDEIDAGVSGRVTQAIAEKLYQLGAQPQVLCVTHQPLVAAMADAHFHVNKTVIQELSLETNTEVERTVVRVTSLAGQQRQQELAQLAGGKSDEDAIAFAESLLTQAAEVRSKLSKTSGTTSTRSKKLVRT
ncbi:MAG: DNA repair protein RecN, partial [Leptolyngbyaceae bacterium]|nr:DNA repair protein RecN [Leptolyngbyaceae bacterium]